MPILEKKQELFKPVKELWGEIGCKDISVFNETNKILNEDKLINTYNNYVDSACYHSINYYDNIKLLLLVNLSKNKAYNYYVNNLKQTHIIYGIKTIDVKFDLLDKIYYIKLNIKILIIMRIYYHKYPKIIHFMISII